MPTPLLLAMGYAFASALQPGPLVAYLFSRTVEHGWRRALPLCLTPMISDGPVILLVLLLLVRVPAWILPMLQCAGGALVVLLGFRTLRPRSAVTGQSEPPAMSRSLLQGVAINILNPAPYLGWTLVLGPLLLQEWNVSLSRGIGFLAAFYGTMTVSLAGMVLLMGATGRLAPGTRQRLFRFSGMLLILVGAVQIFLGISRILSSPA